MQENGKNVIEITIVKGTKIKEKVNVFFEQNVKATLNAHSPNPKPIFQGESFEEGAVVFFEATLSGNKALESWFINDLSKEANFTNDKLRYVINANDARDEAGSKVIRIKFTEKDAKDITF